MQNSYLINFLNKKYLEGQGSFLLSRRRDGGGEG